MTHPTPTAADFKARHPRFAAVADATADAVIADAVLHCGDDWSAADFRAGALSLAAHMMLEEGALSAGAPSQNAGAVVRKKAGDLELEFADTAARLRGDDGATWGSTVYGRAYLAIRRRYVGAAALVV